MNREIDPTEATETADPAGPTTTPFSRRRFLSSSAVAAGTLAATAALDPTFLIDRAAAATTSTTTTGTVTTAVTPRPTNNVLVVIFLRGGADGLAILAPVGDGRYHGARPTVGVPDASALAVNSLWGLHPSAPRLKSMYDAGRLALIPASGSPDVGRSHFSAQAIVEIGAGLSPTFSNGWLGRYLTASALPTDSTLRSFASGATVPDSLTGAFATSSQSLSSFQLSPMPSIGTRTGAPASSALDRMYRGTSNTMLKAQALSGLSTVSLVGSSTAKAVPPSTMKAGLGRSLFPIAKLINDGKPLEVATVDMVNWDTHVLMGPATSTTGTQSKLIANLDSGLGAFFDYLGTNAARVTVVVMTEFGRRIAENVTGGTDHGHGSLMLVAGAGVSGGVKGDWPGLTNTIQGDVRVVNDQRTVLAEVLGRRMRSADLTSVFPGFTTASSTWLGVTA